MPEALKEALVLQPALPHQRWAIADHRKTEVGEAGWERDGYLRVWTFFSLTVTGYPCVWMFWGSTVTTQAKSLSQTIFVTLGELTQIEPEIPEGGTWVIIFRLHTAPWSSWHHRVRTPCRLFPCLVDAFCFPPLPSSKS